jgi:hypothetical protein
MRMLKAKKVMGLLHHLLGGGGVDDLKHPPIFARV